MTPLLEIVTVPESDAPLALTTVKLPFAPSLASIGAENCHPAVLGLVAVVVVEPTTSVILTLTNVPTEFRA